MFSVRGGPYYTALTEQDDPITPTTKGGLHAPPATLTTHPGKGALFPCDQALDTHRKASLITPTTTSTTNTTTTTLTHITTTTSTNTINNNNLLHHHPHLNTSINNNTGGGGVGSSNNSGSTPGLRYHSSSLDNSLLSSSHQARGTISGSGGGSSGIKGGGSSSPLSLTSLKAAWKSLTSITSSSSSSKLPHLERQADTLAILTSSSSSSSSSGHHHHHQGSSSSHHLQQGQDYRYTQVPSGGTSALQILSGGGGSGGSKRHKDGVSGGGSCVGGGLHHQTLHNTHIYLTPATRSYTHPHRSPLQPPPASSLGGSHHHHHGGGGGARGSNNSSSFRTNASSHSSRSGGNFSSSSSSVSRATGEALTLAKCLRKHKEKQQKIHEQALTRKSKSDNALQKIGVNLKSQSDQNLHKVWLVGAGGSQASSCCTTNNSIFSTVQLSGGSGDSTASVASNNSSSSYKKRRRRLLAGIGLEEEIRRREQQQEEREERSRSLERHHGNRIHSSSNTRRHTRSLERNHKFRVDLRNLIHSPPLCPHIDPTPPDHPAPSPPTHAIPFLPSSTSSSTHPSSHSFHSSSNSPSLPSYSSSSHSSSNTYSPTPHDTFSSTAHPRLGTIAASAHSPFQSSLASAHSSFHSSLASAHSSHSSGSSGSGGFLPSSSSLEGRLCCTAVMDATTNGTTAGPAAPGGSSFINKPARGWLHSDTQLAETGVTYGVRYIGCLEVKTSMKSLNFDTRSLIAKECISRVCEAAGLKTVDRRRKVVKAIGRILGEAPVMQHAGSNVTLTITSTALSLSLLDNGVIIAHHDMPNISFASGGDPDTLDFIAYVAKDCLYGRACFVLECGGGQAQNVITSIGQAFEMRFKEYLKKTPQPSIMSPAGGAAVGSVTGGATIASLINNVNAPLSTLAAAAAQPCAAAALTHNNNLNAPSAGGGAPPSVNYTTVNNPDRLGCPRNDDPEYYNDLPGKVPPDLIPPVSQPPPVPPLPNYNSSTVQQQQQQLNNISTAPSVLSNPVNNGSSNNLTATGTDVSSESLDDQTAALKKGCYVACSPPMGDAPRPPSAAAGTNLIDLCGDALSPAPSSAAGSAVAPLRCEPEYANVPLSKQGGGEGAAATPKDPFDMQPFTAPLSQAEPSSGAPKCLSAQQRRELQQESWYHGPITRIQAEQLLKQDGDFLVRESLNTSGQYVLTGVQNNTPKHLLLIDPNGAIRTKCQTFSSVSHLINYHRDNELPIVSNESALVLRNPVIRHTTPQQPR